MGLASLDGRLAAFAETRAGISSEKRPVGLTGPVGGLGGLAESLAATRSQVLMVVFGIDPSLRCTGWGVLTGVAPDEPSLVSYGQVALPQWNVPERLATLYTKLSALVASSAPNLIAWERPFVGSNSKTAMVLGYVAGVVQLVAEQQGIESRPYAPSSIKKAVTGNGHASKEHVAYIVRRRLSMATEDIFIGTDASDALAVAMTGYYWRGA